MNEKKVSRMDRLDVLDPGPSPSTKPITTEYTVYTIHTLYYSRQSLFTTRSEILSFNAAPSAKLPVQALTSSMGVLRLGIW